MPTTLQAESTLTDRYQTTVPETVRRTLRLNKRDKIHYTILSSGKVMLTRATPTLEQDDPILNQFLDFLATDITDHPERLQTLDKHFVRRLQARVGNLEIDLDVPLSAADECRQTPSGHHQACV